MTARKPTGSARPAMSAWIVPSCLGADSMGAVRVGSTWMWVTKPAWLRVRSTTRASAIWPGSSGACSVVSSAMASRTASSSFVKSDTGAPKASERDRRRAGD